MIWEAADLTILINGGAAGISALFAGANVLYVSRTARKQQQAEAAKDANTALNARYDDLLDRVEKESEEMRDRHELCERQHQECEQKLADMEARLALIETKEKT